MAAERPSARPTARVPRPSGGSRGGARPVAPPRRCRSPGPPPPRATARRAWAGKSSSSMSTSEPPERASPGRAVHDGRLRQRRRGADPTTGGGGTSPGRESSGRARAVVGVAPGGARGRVGRCPDLHVGPVEIRRHRPSAEPPNDGSELATDTTTTCTTAHTRNPAGDSSPPPTTTASTPPPSGPSRPRALSSGGRTPVHRTNCPLTAPAPAATNPVIANGHPTHVPDRRTREPTTAPRMPTALPTSSADAIECRPDTTPEPSGS